MGCPLLGDWLYGTGDSEKHMISRQALHAKRLVFAHPVTKNIIDLSSVLPDEMEKLLNLD
jgi:23S rRNA pseudouridine1911/1915/1917 synthase